MVFGLAPGEREKNYTTNNFILQTQKHKRCNIKNNTNICDRFRKKEKAAAIFFDMEKVYYKIN